MTHWLLGQSHNDCNRATTPQPGLRGYTFTTSFFGYANCTILIPEPNKPYLSSIE